MINLNGEYDLIEYLKEQDLHENRVVLNVHGEFKQDKIQAPFYIAGYLADRKTGSFPIGDRFRLTIKWDTREGVEKSIKHIEQSIKELNIK